MDLSVANIGEGVDALLGMNFMYSAGVRLCAREGLVKHLDEETVLLAGRTAYHMGRGLDLGSQEARGTACPAEAGVRAALRSDSGIPMAMKLLVRSPVGSAQVHMVQLQPRPNVEAEDSLAKTDIQLSETETSGTTDSEGTESREAKLIEETGETSGDRTDRAFRIALGFPDRDCPPEEWSGHTDVHRLPCSEWVHSIVQLPLPVIDDLLTGFESAMWFMGLDMASSFWAIRMTERAKLISAFVCPFGHFQWVRMPFGLKNAPLVYQALINNCLWGFVRLSPEEEAEVDQDVVEFLGLDPSRREESGIQVSALTDTVTVFQRNIPAPVIMGPVLGRSSYIDDIAHGAPTWDQLCDDLDALLFRLRYWNISVSLPKNEFGKLYIPYLSHEISAEGIRAVPKIAKGVQDVPFPKTLKGVQSFLGSLNYYHKFIEDFPVVATVLYELSDDQVRSERGLTRAKAAFEILKKKIVSTLLLRHPDRSKPFVIIPHANRWAACAVLGPEYGRKIQPVRFTGRVLNDAELFAEKEVIAVLQVFRTLIVGCRLEVYTRHSVFKWILQSKTANGRCVPCGVMLSHWDITVRTFQRDEDGLTAIVGAGITPRDEVAESLIPAKGHVLKPPVLRVEMLDDTYQGIFLSYDGAAKTSTRRGSCGCILWQLPDWKVLEARGFTLDDVSVNDAEYNGLLKGVQMALDRQVENLVVVGDSRIVIQQVQGLINCHISRNTWPNANPRRRSSGRCDWFMSNGSPEELLHLERVSKIAEKLMKPKVVLLDGEPPQDSKRLGLPQRSAGGVADSQSAPLPQAARVFAVLTRSKTKARTRPSPQVVEAGPPDEEVPRNPMTPLEYQAERWRRIRVHQEQAIYRSEIKSFLKGDSGRSSPRRLRKISKVADLFALDARDTLYRLARSTRGRPRDVVDEPRLVIPDSLRSDMLHYAHEDFQGGHQGITRFYWPGMYADVEHYVKECVDCASGKGRPPNDRPSPGNIEPRRPFEVVSMDFVTHIPGSERGNTFLLLFQDAFSGFVMYKPMRSTTAQDVAEVYEECVFRRFGASSMVRHDQGPRFMSAVFTRFRELLGSKQRATLAYCPQANGQQERSVQTVVPLIRAYIDEADQSHWDNHEHVFDATRLDTPFHLVHGWDAQGTLSDMLGPKPSSIPERTAFEWRWKIQRQYSYAIACAEDLQKKAKRQRSEAQTQKGRELSETLQSGFEKGDSA
ncbi:unnamed protein product [Phytophthora fragariaefolia]|uniref:Unnamed protein product n=1 Tax=Phytophthora fragariaefolia TaxID=1490495 RepID=A0A9W6XCD7_9STRA|nr:unnamed protein product [Phytophthora fragariaefolia]